MDPEEKEKMEKRDWLTEKIQMLNTQLEGFEADVEKAVSHAFFLAWVFSRFRHGKEPYAASYAYVAPSSPVGSD